MTGTAFPPVARQPCGSHGKGPGMALPTGARTAFIRLLEDTAKLQSWTLVTEVGQKVQGHTIRPDATLYKSAVPRGYYEAKDTKDDLDSEIRKKIAKGYPLKNIIFEDSRQAVLYQNKQEVFRAE